MTAVVQDGRGAYLDLILPDTLACELNARRMLPAQPHNAEMPPPELVPHVVELVQVCAGIRSSKLHAPVAMFKTKADLVYVLLERDPLAVVVEPASVPSRRGTL